MSLDDLRIKRFSHLNSNTKVQTKPLKDCKKKSNKSPTNKKQKTKINLFPGVILPLKKKRTTKEIVNKTELLKYKNTENNSKEKVKPSSLEKNDWTKYMKQEKPARIDIEQPNNRKFFKTKVVQTNYSYK